MARSCCPRGSESRSQKITHRNTPYHRFSLLFNGDPAAGKEKDAGRTAPETSEFTVPSTFRCSRQDLSGSRSSGTLLVVLHLSTPGDEPLLCRPDSRATFCILGRGRSLFSACAGRSAACRRPPRFGGAASAFPSGRPGAARECRNRANSSGRLHRPPPRAGLQSAPGRGRGMRSPFSPAGWSPRRPILTKGTPPCRPSGQGRGCPRRTKGPLIAARLTPRSGDDSWLPRGL
jgi:hypothetical protein